MFPASDTLYRESVMNVPVIKVLLVEDSFSDAGLLSIYRSITEGSRDCIQVLDLEGRLQFMSPSGQHLFEIEDIGQILRQSFEEFWKDSDPKVLRAAMERARHGQSGSFSSFCPTANGEPRWWDVIISPIFGEDGQVERLLAVSRDVTKRKHSEEALRQAHDKLELRVQERTAELVQINRALQAEIAERRRAQEAHVRLAALVESSDAAIFGVANNSTITSWNRGAEQIFGCSQEEMVGSSVDRLVPVDRSAVLSQCLAKIIRGERLNPFETVLVTNGGQRIFAHVTLSPIQEHGGQVRGVSVVCRDITELKRLENGILQISEHEQQRFGRDLHDGLTQQLAGITYLSNILHQRLAAEEHATATDSARICELLNEAVSQAHGLAHGLHPVKMENNGLMSALGKLAASIKDIYRISCRFVCKFPVLIHDNTTATHLYRISQEAVHNALRHGKASRVIIELAEDDQTITLRVRDNGCGLIPEAAQTTGMGLKTMSYRARTIGGTLELKRAPAGGTIVVCVLPKSASAG